MNLSRDTFIDWLESLREYNEDALARAVKPTLRRVLEAENEVLSRTIRALVDGEDCSVDSVPKSV
jgi:hypothetical protein